MMYMIYFNRLFPSKVLQLTILDTYVFWMFISTRTAVQTADNVTIWVLPYYNHVLITGTPTQQLDMGKPTQTHGAWATVLFHCCVDVWAWAGAWALGPCELGGSQSSSFIPHSAHIPPPGPRLPGLRWCHVLSLLPCWGGCSTTAMRSLSCHSGAGERGLRALASPR